MDSVDLDVLRTSTRWLAAGRRVLLATVVRTWGSSPRPVGALLALRDDGLAVGSVSGGCIEDDLVARVREAGIAPMRARRRSATASAPTRRIASACPAAARSSWCWSR